MCAYKNIGQEESILLLLFLPDGVLWSCLHAVSVSELSVDFVFFLLARHSRASSVSALASFVSCSQDGADEPPLLCATSLTRGEP